MEERDGEGERVKKGSKLSTCCSPHATNNCDTIKWQGLAEADPSRLGQQPLHLSRERAEQVGICR